MVDPGALAARLRPWVVPLLLLGALEIYARTVAAGSDAIAPPSAAVLAWAGALRDGSLWQATPKTGRRPWPRWRSRCPTWC